MDKGKIKELISKTKNLSSYEERLSFLKDKFKGGTCYILGCGPSLKEVDKEKLKLELENNCLMTIKQSYFSFAEFVDFQFFNTNNFTRYPEKEDKIYIGSSDWNPEHISRAMYWKNQQVDICTRVVGKILNKDKHGHGQVERLPLSKRQYLEDFDGLENYTFEKTGLKREWGAGIMYENVLFFALHLGFGRIRTVGWDYTNTTSGDNTFYHFYNNKSQSKMMNPAKDPYNEEMEDSINLSGVFNTFFDQNDISLQCYKSEQCYIHESVKRYTI